MPDERPRSNPDLVPPHRCSLVCVWNALPKHPLSSRRFQAHRQLALHHKKPLVAAKSLRRRYAHTRATALSRLEIGSHQMRFVTCGWPAWRNLRNLEAKNRMRYATVSEILALRSRLPVIWKHPPRGLGQSYVATRLVFCRLLEQVVGASIQTTKSFVRAIRMILC